jgi:endonuclease III-like uncharacterized protein
VAGSTSRTVNVNIKYNVDTVEVVKAQAASRNAQKATDDLRKATEDYGKASAKAAKEASASLKQVQSDTRGLSSGFNDLYTAVKAVFTASLVSEVVNMTLSMAKLSGQVEGVTIAFNKLPNATLLIDNLRQSTHGTVTDLELMQKALSAQNFRIPLQNLGKLMEFAAVKAQQTGQEVNHLVDYIVSGIGYRSIKRLDDLGFTANRVKGALGDVSLQAASMQQVMDAVTKLMDEDLQKTGGYAETTATKVGQLETMWNKLKVTVSETLTSPSILNFYENALKYLNVAARTVQSQVVGKDLVVEDEAKAQALLNVKRFQEAILTKDILKDKQKTYDIVQQEINSSVQLIGRNNDEIAAIKKRYNEIVDGEGLVKYEQEEELDRLKEQNNFYNFKNKMLTESNRILKEYLATVNQVSEEEKKPKEDNTRGLLQALPTKVTVKKDAVEDFIKETQKLIDDLTLHGTFLQNRIDIPIHPYVPNDFRDKLEIAIKDHKDDIANAGVGILSDQLNNIENSEVISYQNRLNNLQNYYQDQIKLAGNNEKKKQELELQSERQTNKLRNEIAQKEWKARRNSVIIDTAAGIIRAFATLPTQEAIVESVLIAATGASSLAIVNKNKPQAFAKGVLNLRGPGTETSDSIPAYLSKGESVMTAAETKRSMGLLEAIKHNKIDDRILRKIDFSGGNRAIVMNDEKIVKAIQSQKFPNPPDLVKQGHQLYEYHKDKDGNKRKIRRNSI